MIKKIIRYICSKTIYRNTSKNINRIYFKRFKKHSFVGNKCDTFCKSEALIIKLYHSVEKGLSYQNYRAGFGKKNICDLIGKLEDFSKKYGTEHFCYQTALSVLHEYVNKNRVFNHVDEEIESKISNLEGCPNNLGGVIEFYPLSNQVDKLNFYDFVKSRHSVRCFSNESVSIEALTNALLLAQHTPSACNRQGWRTIIVSTKERIREVLKNQNGNMGFGDNIDKLLLVVFDLNCFNGGRECFQGFIDGGMYAMNILHALHYYRVGSVPLSASLTPIQEKNLRTILNLDDNIMPVMFIGVGMYNEKVVTTKSERKEPNISVI